MVSTLPSMQPTTTTAPTAERTASESLVDRDSHFDGLYRTKQNLRVEGVAEGEIECEGTLTVVKGARVKAKITARNVTVAGELEGEVTCQDTFQIMPSGQVEATVTARRLIVQEGGFYNGEFHMTSEEPTVSTTARSATDRRTEEWLARLTSTESSSHETKDDESG